jgi:alpha-mannosidase
LTGKDSSSLDLNFSKPLDPATAALATSYSIQPALAVSKITLSADGRSVTLTFASAIPAGTDFTVSLSGIKDKSANANLIVPTSLPFNAENIAYTLKSAELPAQNAKVQVAGLPLQKNDAWTINLWIKPAKENSNRAIIAGFGSIGDFRNGGTGRYFGVFDSNISFGVGRRGVRTGSPLESDRWQMLTATYDGKTIAVYKDGDPIGNRDVELNNDTDSSVSVGLVNTNARMGSFNGAVQTLTVRRGALDDAGVKQLFATTKPAP